MQLVETLKIFILENNIQLCTYFCIKQHSDLIFLITNQILAIRTVTTPRYCLKCNFITILVLISQNNIPPQSSRSHYSSDQETK